MGILFRYTTGNELHLALPVMRYISLFLNSTVGMYLVQSFCHAVIAALITSRAMKAWQIRDPFLRQRFRLAVILIAVGSFPLYQVLDPSRGTAHFRLSALFDVNRWLFLEIGGVFPVAILFLLMVAATAVLFLFQEMMPVVGHTLATRGHEREGTFREPDDFLRNSATSLTLDPPRVCIVDDDEPLIFSSVGKRPVITISTGLERELTADQLRAALAHELAHISRNRRPFLTIVFILRVALFFNPVVLVKFRGVVRDEEKICDELAVRLTGDRDALASALERFAQKPAEAPALERQSLQAFTTSLEEQSHYEQLQSRIDRLRHPPAPPAAGTPALILAACLIIVLNYFIV